MKEPAKFGPLIQVPVNQFAMLTDYVDPEERSVACPNQDVVYGIGAIGLDLSSHCFGLGVKIKISAAAHSLLLACCPRRADHTMTVASLHWKVQLSMSRARSVRGRLWAATVRRRSGALEGRSAVGHC